MDNNQVLNERKSQVFQKVFFFVLGVSSLSGWNAVLAGLNYFNDQFAELKLNIFFLFPIPNFVSLCCIGLMLPLLSKYLSLQFRIAWSLIALSALLLLLPILAALFNNSFLGFTLCILTILLMGVFGAFEQNSSIGMAGLLGGEYVNIFFLGTGMSGTIICLFRFVSLAALKDSPGASVLLYCGVAALWNVGASIMFFAFKKTPQYRLILKAHKKGKKSVLVHDQIVTEDVGIEHGIANIDSDLLQSDASLHLPPEHTKSDSIQIERMNPFQTLFWINKLAFPIPLLIVALYIQTFLMFPGVAFEKEFTSISSDWGQNLINFSYNFGDTVGKAIAGKRSLFNQFICVVLLMLRFVFFFFYIEIALDVFEADWVAYLNTFLFAAFNGFLTTALMILGPEKTDEGFVKEKVGFVQGFSLQVGIMLGTFLALPFSALK